MLNYRHFYIEITADDRLSLEYYLAGGQVGKLRIRYETFRRNGKVIHDVEGFDPFFDGEWFAVVRYDNLKGDATREVVRSTPLVQSAFGLKIQDNWGRLSALDFINRIFEDLQANWSGHRLTHNPNLDPIEPERERMGTSNVYLSHQIAIAIAQNVSDLEKLQEGQTIMPQPSNDDWLLEQNSIAINRIDKRATRGELIEMPLSMGMVFTNVKV